MRTYIVRRLLLVIPVIALVSVISFFLMHLAPGNLVDALIASQKREAVQETKIDVEQIMRDLGLDRPLTTQYAAWLGIARQPDGNFSGVFQGKFGTSWWFRKDVVELMGTKWPVTLELGLMGLIISQLIALPIGIYSALRQDKWGDYVGRSLAIVLISVPSFWVATMVVVFPSLWWGYATPMRLIHLTEDPIGNLGMFIIPAILLGMAMSGGTMRLTRSMMLEVLRQDYIRTAWAKGLRERVVTLRHASKNALIPVVTVIGMQVPVMLGGTVIIETIFNLPGMGRLAVSATVSRDYPLISGLLLFIGTFLVLMNLVTDLTYAYLDPRVHYK